MPPKKQMKGTRHAEPLPPRTNQVTPQREGHMYHEIECPRCHAIAWKVAKGSTPPPPTICNYCGAEFNKRYIYG